MRGNRGKMSKKTLLGLILFGSLTVCALIIGANIMIHRDMKPDNGQNISFDQAKQDGEENESSSSGNEVPDESNQDADAPELNTTPSAAVSAGQTVSDAPGSEDAGQDATERNLADADPDQEQQADLAPSDNPTESSGNSAASQDVLGTSAENFNFLQLIYDSENTDYMSYIPQMNTDSEIKNALNIDNPQIELKAKAAILFDVDTKEVLFYKNAVEPIFPASTAKLLNSLVALDWCTEEEQITVGDEVGMIATDATRAYLKPGQVLTLHNLLEGMLLPSGNDAAFAMAAYVGRKSLQNKNASAQAAILEFVRLMNEKAAALGAKNSCFKTPDGYDAIGQFTTAYDMGRIGLAAIDNDILCGIVKKSRSRNVFISGEDVTWYNTNALINKNSARYYSRAIGLKTGTSTMAGKCLIAAAKKDGREVVCAVMDSSTSGRWEDATALLKYGLQ